MSHGGQSDHSKGDQSQPVRSKPLELPDYRNLFAARKIARVMKSAADRDIKHISVTAVIYGNGYLGHCRRIKG